MIAALIKNQIGLFFCDQEKKFVEPKIISDAKIIFLKTFSEYFDDDLILNTYLFLRRNQSIRKPPIKDIYFKTDLKDINKKYFSTIVLKKMDVTNIHLKIIEKQKSKEYFTKMSGEFLELTTNSKNSYVHKQIFLDQIKHFISFDTLSKNNSDDLSEYESKIVNMLSEYIYNQKLFGTLLEIIKLFLLADYLCYEKLKLDIIDRYFDSWKSRIILKICTFKGLKDIVKYFGENIIFFNQNSKLFDFVISLKYLYTMLKKKKDEGFNSKFFKKETEIEIGILTSRSFSELDYFEVQDKIIPLPFFDRISQDNIRSYFANEKGIYRVYKHDLKKFLKIDRNILNNIEKVISKDFFF